MGRHEAAESCRHRALGAPAPPAGVRPPNRLRAAHIHALDRTASGRLLHIKAAFSTELQGHLKGAQRNHRGTTGTVGTVGGVHKSSSRWTEEQFQVPLRPQAEGPSLCPHTLSSQQNLCHLNPSDLRRCGINSRCFNIITILCQSQAKTADNLLGNVKCVKCRSTASM